MVESFSLGHVPATTTRLRPKLGAIKGEGSAGGAGEGDGLTGVMNLTVL